MKDAPTLLQDNRLKRTKGRIDILEIFIENTSLGLSEGDIEDRLELEIDRATIYRTIRTFIDAGLIHRIADDDGVMKYALCGEACEDYGHDHDHIHFKCEHCQRTECLENIMVAKYDLPQGYVPRESNFLIIGICKECSNKMTMYHLYKREEKIGTIDEIEFKKLEDLMEEDSVYDRDYYIDQKTIDYLENQGATKFTVELLRKAIGDGPGAEIRWSKD